jgi:hypothetical protein
MKVGVVGVVAGILVPALFIFSFAQDFPYAAPQAPEFDDAGIAAPERRPEVAPSDNRGRKTPAPVDYRAVRPYAPEVQQAPNVPGNSIQAVAPAPTQRPNHRQQPMPVPQPQAQNGRPDCSEYPMRIARAQSEPEMKQIAQYYLGCLLQNGWQKEQAQQQVITTIESTYRLTR